MTIREIAERAGVSKAAVSRYLNQGYLSAEKSERIRQVIEETGYIPSQQARNLRTGRTHTIGVVLPRIDSESISRIVAGIGQVLHARGFQLLLTSTDNDVHRELAALEYFKNNQADGVLFIATILTPAHKTIIESMPVPVVMIGQRADYLSCVYHDDRAAARELTALLLRGRQHPGMLYVTTQDAAAGRDRLDGFYDALAAAGFAPADAAVEQADFSIEAGYDTARVLFTRAPETDALLCATDSIALGAMKYLYEQGRLTAVSIAGIGHSRLSSIVTPRLTTAHYHYRTSGAEAAKMLLQIIDSEIDLKKSLQLGYRIVPQETTLEV